MNTDLSAIATAAGLARGDFTSEELVTAFVARHRECGDASRSFILTTHEAALTDARRLDAERRAGRVRGPLHGLPLSVKDNIDLAGHASTLGLLSRRDHAAPRDAVLVAALREAGMIVLGKTNVPQALASGMECDNNLFGPTFHPLSREHGPGGSSSGEAVALATGESLLGIGTDLGGSIRFPAAYCGVAGLKPTTDRWSNSGVVGAIPGQEVVRAQVGPMARTAADLRFFWNAVDPAHQTPHDPLIPPVPHASPPPMAGLRVGWFEDDGLVRPTSAVLRALHEARAVLEAAGCTLVHFPPENQRELVELYVGVLGADGLRTVAARMRGDRPVQPFQTMWRVGRVPGFVRRLAAWALARAGEGRMAAMARAAGTRRVDELYRLAARRVEMRRAEMAAWNDAHIDAILCPATTTAAVPVGLSHDFALTFGYTGRFNVLGLPAGVVPAGAVRREECEPDRRPLNRMDRIDRIDRIDRRILAISARSEGLPLSVQIVGRPWREDVVLALMCQIEEGLAHKG